MKVQFQSTSLRNTKFTLINNIIIENSRYNINNNDCLFVHIRNIKHREVNIALSHQKISSIEEININNGVMWWRSQLNAKL
jgi:hypothetical protein